MTDTFLCTCCGRETARKSANQKYCTECREYHLRELQQASAKRTRARREAGILPPSKGGKARIVHCERCGALIAHPATNQKYCDKCRDTAYTKREMDYNATKKADQTKPAPLPKKDYSFLTPSMAPEGWSLVGKSADQVTIEARTLGLSYGQYSSYVTSGFIERYCRDLGVDGLEVTAKAWKKFKTSRKKKHKKGQYCEL